MHAFYVPFKELRGVVGRLCTVESELRAIVRKTRGDVRELCAIVKQLRAVGQCI